MNFTNITYNLTQAPQIESSCFVSTPKVIITFGLLVVVQVTRAIMHYKNIRKYEKGEISKDKFINNQYLMGILDISSYPLIVFLIFVFMRLF